MTDYVFPGLQATFSRNLPPLSTVIVAGGRKPSLDWLRELSRGRALWAVDGGLEACFAATMKPDRLIGDGDSASSESWEKALASGVTIDRYPREKDWTDLQIALKTLGGEKKGSAIVTGCWGGRFDHLFGNVFSLIGARKWLAEVRCMGDEREFLFLLSGGDEIQVEWSRKPTVLSLLPLERQCRGVSLDGVRWPLTNASLEQAMPYAVSNEPQDGPVQLNLAKGELALYLGWAEREG